MLLAFTGPLPQVVWHDAQPDQIECRAALTQASLPSEWHCFAVTYAITDPRGPYSLVIASHDQPFRVFVTEAIRSINNARGVTMSAAAVYAIAARSGECQP